MNRIEYNIICKMLTYNEYLKDELTTINTIIKQLKETEKRYLNAKTIKHRKELHSYYNLKISFLKKSVESLNREVQDLVE